MNDGYDRMQSVQHYIRAKRRELTAAETTLRYLWTLTDSDLSVAVFEDVADAIVRRVMK